MVLKKIVNSYLLILKSKLSLVHLAKCYSINFVVT